MTARERIGSGGTFHQYRDDLVPKDSDIDHSGTKTDISAQIEQLLTEILQSKMEIIRAYMGFGIDQDVFRCTAGDKVLQNEAVTDVLGSGIQFSVGEGTGTALTELNITGGIQHTGGPETFHICLALLDILTTLQQNRFEAGTGQNQSCKKTCGSGTGNYRSLCEVRWTHKKALLVVRVDLVPYL